MHQKLKLHVLVELCVKKILSCARKIFKLRKKFKLNVVQEKVIRVLQVKQKTKEITAISSTLFRNQKSVPVGTCHDVRGLSYDNQLYNRTRLNQSIESLCRIRKETTCSALIHQKLLQKV